MWIDASLLVVAYLLGSVSGSLLLGRWRGVDIRTLGSGNAGGTNAFRTQGWKFALGTALIDVSKGAIATALAARLGSGAGWLPYAATLAATAGHIWPIWHGFRGGKGAATLFGGLLWTWPAVVPVLLVAWALVLSVGGYVGLATMVAAWTLIPVAWFGDADRWRWAFAIAAALLLLYTHRANLRRMLAGTESRFERARIWRRWASRKTP